MPNPQLLAHRALSQAWFYTWPLSSFEAKRPRVPEIFGKANHDPIFNATQHVGSPFVTRMVRRILSENTKNRLSAREILALPAIAELPPTWLLGGDMIEPKSGIFWEE
jgi:hypothetical protein